MPLFTFSMMGNSVLHFNTSSERMDDGESALHFLHEKGEDGDDALHFLNEGMDDGGRARTFSKMEWTMGTTHITFSMKERAMGLSTPSLRRRGAEPHVLSAEKVKS